MKDLKLKLVVEVIRRDDDVTDEVIIKAIKELVLESGIGNGKFRIKIKDVQPTRLK